MLSKSRDKYKQENKVKFKDIDTGDGLSKSKERWWSR